MSIVDLAVAARHLSVNLEDDGEGVADMLQRVEEMILDYLEREEYGDDDPPPSRVQQAVLLALTEVYDKRNSDPLTPGVIALLIPYRSPGVF